MQLFVFHKDPIEAAKMLDDKRVIKLILETSQLLSTALWQNNEIGKIKQTHHNHPCAIFARKTRANFLWVVDYMQALLCEYTLRYGKIHKYSDHIAYYRSKANCIPQGNLTSFALAMPDKYKTADACKSHQNYYIGEKLHNANWRLGNQPIWTMLGEQ